MAILTETEAQEQYKATIDYIANTAIFQYTFVLTVGYVFSSTFYTTPGSSYEFLGFAFTHTQWGLIANFSAAAINLYIARHLSYLATLASLYPQKRRKFRFLTRHHHWFLNPFRVNRITYRIPVMSSFLYMFVVIIGLFPSVHMLDTDPHYQALSQVRNYEFWFTYILGSFLSLLHLISSYVVISRITFLGNCLWRGRYLPKTGNKKSTLSYKAKRGQEALRVPAKPHNTDSQGDRLLDELLSEPPH